jgi:hypothetical protein
MWRQSTRDLTRSFKNAAITDITELNPFIAPRLPLPVPQSRRKIQSSTISLPFHQFYPPSIITCDSIPHELQYEGEAST